jgi:hypothetical protein
MRVRLLPTLLGAFIAAGALLATSVAPAAARQSSAKTALRAWKVRIRAPAQFDLTLAQISFGAPAHAALGPFPRPSRGMRLALDGVTGLDYVAAAVTRPDSRGRPRALVLVVNRRPRGSLAPDLAQITLTVTVARRLGDPLVLQASAPFTRPTGLQPALCDLPLRGAALGLDGLGAALSRGRALSGWSAQAAIAQAYDAVCRLPYSQAFRQTVTQGSGVGCQPRAANPVACCPANAMCVPLPCPPCPCGPGPCPVPLAAARADAIVCPLSKIPQACPL